MQKKYILLLGLVLVAAAAGGFYLFFPQDDNGTTQPPRVCVVGCEERESGEQTPPITIESFAGDRTLAKEQGSADTFWVQNGKKYRITSNAVLALMREVPGWSTTTTVEAGSLASVTSRGDFIAADSTSDGLLLKMEDAPHLFRVFQGKRDYLPPDEFARRGYLQDDIIEVSVKIFKDVVPPADDILHLSLQDAVDQGNTQVISTGNFFKDIATFESEPFEQDAAINIEKGDVLVSKDEKQSLVVTQDYEVFVPQGSPVVIEGLFGACIDRFKDWPAEGEVLDVTYNLERWNTDSAAAMQQLIETIDADNVHAEQSSQDAVWNISDREPVGAEAAQLMTKAGVSPGSVTFFPHLSNPEPAEDSEFVIPPELSLPGIVARHQQNCPTGDSDIRICQAEIELAMEHYLTGEPFPATTNQTVDSRILSHLIARYVTNTTVQEALPVVTQATINQEALSLIASLKQQGFVAPGFSVVDVTISPGTTIKQETALFRVTGSGIRDVQVSVFNLADEEIYRSPVVFGSIVEWNVRDSGGTILPTGFYSYKITATGLGGEVFTSDSKQLVVRISQ